MELFQEIKYENDFEHKNRIIIKIKNWPRIFDKKKHLFIQSLFCSLSKIISSTTVSLTAYYNIISYPANFP